MTYELMYVLVLYVKIFSYSMLKLEIHWIFILNYHLVITVVLHIKFER